MKKLIVCSILLTAIFLFAGCGAQQGIYKQGTYTASASGYGGGVTVEVKFSETEILAVDIISHNETAGYGDTAAENIAEKIIEEQTTEVDAVAGATLSSEAVKAAVADCVNQAAQ